MKDDNQKPEKRAKKKENIFKRAFVRVKKTILIYRAEFQKIVWPSRPECIRKTITVVIISIMFGVYISVWDVILGMLFSQLVSVLPI